MVSLQLIDKSKTACCQRVDLQNTKLFSEKTDTFKVWENALQIYESFNCLSMKVKVSYQPEITFTYSE